MDNSNNNSEYAIKAKILKIMVVLSWYMSFRWLYICICILYMHINFIEV